MVLVPLELPAGRGLRTLGPIIDTPFEDPGKENSRNRILDGYRTKY